MLRRHKDYSPEQAAHFENEERSTVSMRIVEQFEPGSIEVAGQPALCDGHADAHRKPLSQRAGRRFDARRPTVFRMAGTFAVKLPEALDVVQSHR